MEKNNNPVKILAIRNTDYIKPKVNGGSAKIFGDGASPQRRKILAAQVNTVLSGYLEATKDWASVDGVAKITLKEEALAKSHRPTDLFNRNRGHIIGTLSFGELLVSINKDSLRQLEECVLNNRTKAVEANISAIDKIELYAEKERLNGVPREQLISLASAGQSIKLELFDHYDHNANQKIIKALHDASREHDISIDNIRYGESISIVAVRNLTSRSLSILASYIGIRKIKPMPYFKASDIFTQLNRVSSIDESLCPSPDNNISYPIVGLIDSGICPNNTRLQPWIYASESFVPNGKENYGHGTMVAGLIANSRTLNYGDSKFPTTQAKLVDVNVFPDGGHVSEEDLIAIIEQVVPKYPEVRVWNLSLGASTPVGTDEFSDFGRFLDEMHDKYNCLFIIAAGNQSDTSFWPTLENHANENRISSPADSIRGLTVGSVAHKENAQTLVKSGESSPFSRIGPGPCFVPKPELSHLGGNVTSSGMYAQTGVLSCGPNDGIYESIGTSFAAPIVSSQAAALFKFFEQNGESTTPERVKALLIHSALLNSENLTSKTVNNYGFGVPGNTDDILYCSPNCITLLIEADVKFGGYEFERVPFPIADCLLTSDKKFKGEILMTLVYSPITDKNFASEYCRTNVDATMGSYDQDKNGKYKFNSQVPVAPKDARKMYEKSQIETGFKWSPVKAYRRDIQGIDVKTWRLKMKVTRRAEEEQPDNPQRATLVLSIRSSDPTHDVYNEMVTKMNQAGWVVKDIDSHIRVEGRA